MSFRNTIKSIAIGSFDGIHIAHQALIEKADALVIIERNGGYLTAGYKRANFTSKVCCFYHFDSIKGLSPKEFVEMLKSDFPKLETIVVGYDFHFGKNKSGNARLLASLCDRKVLIIDEVSVDGISVHSRTIKTYIQEGNMLWAKKLLGRRYHIEGSVIRGQGIGKNALFATLNLEVKSYVLPKEGVYATQMCIAGVWRDSVSFLGHRVSTDGAFAIETHILDKEIAEVRGRVSLAFVGHIRANAKFKSLALLKKQIGEDIMKAKEILSC
ncbi:MAG: bifunctional riboflavin kinase/FAD synthetase [Sulfurovum sp.]|nr:bifunctional riboflavin kinase/FAD synthetase [Sulfurovum sp.]